MRPLFAVLGILLLAAPALAAEETKPLEEMQALKIRVLILERQMIEQKSARIQAEGNLLLLQNQGDYGKKAKELDAAIEAAAKEADVDLKDGWQPDVDAKVWKKK